MKRISVLAVLVGASMWVMVPHLSASVVAYWDFSSDSNGVTDVSGNCHTLTNSGVVVSNGVAVFNGAQAAFNTVSTLDLRGYGNMTVEFFMRTAGAASAMILVEQANPFFSNTGAFIATVNETSVSGQVMGGFCNNSAGTKLNLDITPAGAAADSQWHHVAIVYDKGKTGADRSMLYFDGVAQGIYSTWTNDTFVTYCNGTLYLGMRGNGTMKYVGELDDVRISDTALAPAQFLPAHTAGTPPVIAHWRFDEGAGLADSSGNGNTLAGVGVAFTNGTACLYGTGTFNTASALNLTAYSNLTVELFMRTTAATSTMMLVEQSALYWQNTGAFMLDVNETNAAGQVMGGFCNNSAGTKLNLDSSPRNAAADGQWHHIAIVYNRAKTGADRSMLYFDGVAQGTYVTWADGSDAILRNATLYIGSRNNSSMRYAGELDDIRITGAALQPGQFLKAPSTAIPQVIAYWPFSRQQPLADATGNGHALSNAGVTFKDDAAVFDGTQTAFSTKPWTVNLRPYSALTVEYFIRTASTTTNIVIEHSSNFSTYRGGFITVLNEFNPGQIEAGVSMPGTTTYNIDSTAPGAITDGKWHHVALVLDPALKGDDRFRVFLDRVKQGKRNASNTSDADTFFLNDVLFIGARNNSVSKFVGELDDLKITGAALAPSAFMEERTYYGGSIIMLQ